MPPASPPRFDPRLGLFFAFLGSGCGAGGLIGCLTPPHPAASHSHLIHPPAHPPPNRARFRPLNPTHPQALEGFCKKAGADPSSVAVEADAKGVEYCWVVVKDAGRSAVEVRGPPGGVQRAHTSCVRTPRDCRPRS